MMRLTRNRQLYVMRDAREQLHRQLDVSMRRREAGGTG